jgi:hypothetical protein
LLLSRTSPPHLTRKAFEQFVYCEEPIRSVIDKFVNT